MYKNMNPSSLGVSGRQSELIELALTYGFRGLDLDVGELLKRATLQGVEEAAKYIRSGKVEIGGWVLPVRLTGDEAAYQEDLGLLANLVETAKQVGLKYCTVDIEPASDSLPYHENFERHRERLAKVGELLGGQDICLGVALQSSPKLGEGMAHQFIHSAEELLTLIRNTGCEHVGLALDTWNWQVGGGGRDQLSELQGKQFVTLVISDVPDDADLSTIGPQERGMPSEDSLPEYGRLVKSLAERGYQGPITIQPHSSSLARMTRDQSVERCANALDQIWALAGVTKSGQLASAKA